MSLCLSDYRLSVPRADIHTNSPKGVFRMAIVPIVYGWDLSPEELEEFDWLGQSAGGSAFFRYNGAVYHLSEFVRIVPQGATGGPFAHYDHTGALKGWDGIATDSYFSGVVVKYIDDELLRVGLYCC